MRSLLKWRPTLANYILVVFSLGAIYYLYQGYALLQLPEVQGAIMAILASLAMLLWFLWPVIFFLAVGLFFLAVGLLVLSPFILFLIWVIRRLTR
ncbi:hypothetical protein [Hymenobacter arizonensis]|uniref:Uncharacterized protein n=1 Tax=Hymenobacter arizonensis TaxID=1227077 RepID=A0A1I6BR89_HYMAR|nr:hypothetical protein [Hymenobacter arizonensis]SFQ83439.1 hypothetical protein SAMN04515668_4966 [Hymenobacter arizonensis]